MKIQIPVSPLDCENHPQPTHGQRDENYTSNHLPSATKNTPYARIQRINEKNSPHIRSFCLERTPLSDIDNLAGCLAPGVGDRKASTGCSPTAAALPEFQSSQEPLDPSQSTPTLVTGTSKKKQPGSERKREQQAKIEALQRELTQLKDFVVELDGDKRATERLLEEEKESNRAMAQEFALREGALQNRIGTLKAMLKMVSLEKDRLMSFQAIEQRGQRRMKQTNA
jgi:hypothetical protein